jgi:hypothetical protein
MAHASYYETKERQEGQGHGQGLDPSIGHDNVVEIKIRAKEEEEIIEDRLRDFEDHDESPPIPIAIPVQEITRTRTTLAD